MLKRKTGLLAGFFSPSLPGLVPSFPRKREPMLSNRRQTKKNRPAGRFLIQQADYFEAAGAAAAAAASAAAEAAEAAAEAAEAAASAAAGAAGAAVASAAGAVVAAGAVASAAGAGAAAGASSFFEQAARATASRETISRDFFMVFP
jgi:hypothetical protein